MVTTRPHGLPFGSLRWDDFEQLCLRLVKADPEVEARKYGDPGQAQYGIDLLARRPGDTAYTVYQCKKVDKFRPADITAAVDKFANGPWATKASHFVLCTTASLTATQLTDRLEAERERLASRGITLVTWDALELSMMLKGRPELVDDFFGRNAVAAFCGQDAADRLAHHDRLAGGGGGSPGAQAGPRIHARRDVISAGRDVTIIHHPPAPPPVRRRPRRLAVIAALGLVTLTATVIYVIQVSGNPAPSPSLAATLTDPLNGANVQSAAFNSSGTVFATGDNTGSTYLWNTATGKVIRTLTDPHSGGVDSVAFSPGRAIIATGDENGNTYLWNLANRQKSTLTDPTSKDVVSVAFSPNGNILAVGDHGGRVYLWNTATGKVIRPLIDPQPGSTRSVAFSRDDTILAVGDDGGRVYLWSMPGGTLITTLSDAAQMGVNSVAFSRDANILAAGDEDGHVYLWNTATGNATTPLPDPQSRGVDSVAFSKDGTTLAAGDANGHVYLWNWATRQVIATLPDFGQTGVNSVAFSPNGTILAAGDAKGRTYLWDAF